MEIEKVIGPTPWYVDPGGLNMVGLACGAVGRGWGTAGVTAVSNPAGVVLLLDFHNYVLPLGGDAVVVWHQERVAGGPTAPVVLRTFSASELRPLRGRLGRHCRRMRRRGDSFVSHAPPSSEVRIPTTAVDEMGKASFPSLLEGLDELLVLCHSSGISESPGRSGSNLAVLRLAPRDGTFEFYPQDWYNNGSFNFEYQWVSRVERDPESGRIRGEGIRIPPFVLDGTNRSIA